MSRLNEYLEMAVRFRDDEKEVAPPKPPEQKKGKGIRATLIDLLNDIGGVHATPHKVEQSQINVIVPPDPVSRSAFRKVITKYDKTLPKEREFEFDVKNTGGDNYRIIITDRLGNI